jgi:hypothetical protein
VSTIWATRGHTWGFRFLLDGGFPDPLVEYDRVFSAIGDENDTWQRVGMSVGLRFADPLQRKDRAGRVIPHEFVLDGSFALEVKSLDDGRRLVWPLVAGEFEKVWNLPAPQSGGRPPKS